LPDLVVVQFVRISLRDTESPIVTGATRGKGGRAADGADCGEHWRPLSDEGVERRKLSCFEGARVY